MNSLVLWLVTSLRDITSDGAVYVAENNGIVSVCIPREYRGTLNIGNFIAVMRLWRVYTRNAQGITLDEMRLSVISQFEALGFRLDTAKSTVLFDVYTINRARISNP